MVGAVGHFTLQPMARTSHKFPASGGPGVRKEAKSTVFTGTNPSPSPSPQSIFTVSVLLSWRPGGICQVSETVVGWSPVYTRVLT